MRESNEIIIADKSRKDAIEFFKSEYPNAKIIKVRTIFNASKNRLGRYAILGR